MSETRENKYRTALSVLQRGRDRMVEELADEVLDQGEDLIEGGYRFHEFLETQGTRLHFLMLLMCQLEQSADALDEVLTAPPPPPRPSTKPKRTRSRSKKVRQELPSEEAPEDF
ncbi:MAG: hypothetical protein AB7I30_08460 [Isosphaeraceae bacterium]